MQTRRFLSIILGLTLLVAFWMLISRTAIAQGGDAWRTYTKVSMVNALAIENDFVWAATDGGVLRWNRTDGTYIKYTTADGLAYNQVWDVAIDRAGRKWFARAFGLSAFDGQSWTTYTTTNGLPNNDVRAVAIDSTGTVWIGTWGGGVSEFDGQKWTAYTTADGLAGNYILTMAIDEGGHKWFATAICRDGGCEGGGVSEFDGQNWHALTPAGPANNDINALAID